MSCALCAVTVSAFGDVFVLRSGARIHGDWVNAGESPIRRYIVRPQPGGQVTFAMHQVVEHVREPKEIAQYEQLAPQRPDTIAEQWQLAEWCRTNGLKEQRRQHLWRVIELDSDHQAARQALGFTEIQGKWVTTKDFQSQKGLVYYQGKWRLPQEVDVIEERRQIERQERDWFGRIKTWRSQLGTDRDAEARKNLTSISEPTAFKALSENLRREKSPLLRPLLVTAVASIRNAAATELIIQTALNDPDAEVFHTCVDHLVARQIPGLPKICAGFLKDANNRRVNRAAYILGRLGDQKTIPALAAALVTTHQVALPANRATSASFVQPTPGESTTAAAATPSMGFSDAMAFSAGRQAKSQSYQVANQEVLAALVKLSGGQSFGFDERAWMNWWASASRINSGK